MAELEQKHLAGLMYKTSVPKETTEDGRKKTRHIPVERPLKLEDILSQRGDGDTFHIVTKDGRKYDVPVKPAPGKPASAENKEG